MGFLDKAKKMAEQAQEKLDEVQKQFNESQGSSQQASAGGPVTEYDKHGRPVGATPPPPAPAPPPAPEAAAAPAPPAPPPAPEAAAAPAPPAPPAPQPEREDEYAPPKMTSGDPLEG
jgi:hypothetical protein